MISTPTIQTLPQKKLVGMSARMSLLQNTTPQLWQRFMQERKHLQNTVGTDLYSLQMYDELYFNNFSPQTEFTKYALAEVSDHSSIPKNMEAFTLESGLYAVFIYQGLPKDFAPAFQYIFHEWLPSSEYQLDHRPHFEVLGKNYDPTNASSEEEIWIPIK